MSARFYRGLTPARLRAFLALMLGAVAVPTAVLVYQAQRQIKWEAFHQYQTLAAELARRIDAELQERVAAEEARGYADYQFLVVAGDPKTSNAVQRSPLAQFPVPAVMPGLLGYFQVDADGSFSTPLVPDAGGDASALGIGPEEWSQRQLLRGTLLSVLSSNRLVDASTRRKDAPAAPKPGARTAAKEQAQSDDNAALEDAGASEYETEPPPQGSAAQARRNAAAPAAPPPPAGRDAIGAVASSAAPATETRVFADEAAPAAQAAFDTLNSPAAEKQEQDKLARVQDLRLEEAYREKKARAADVPKSVPQPVSTPPLKRQLRKEQTAVLQAGAGAIAGDREVVRVQTFESEVAPMELALLDSGHFVLFRKVWRDGRRTIQGAIIEQREFLDGLIARAFHASALAPMSDLVVAFRDGVLKLIHGTPERGYLNRAEELQGTLLHQARLSPPLQDLQLIWTVQRLPPGPGAQVIGWTSGVLALVLLLGFVGLERLGMRQIVLARQQQDFVSAVSHELKTPLTSIRMYGEMLREGWVGEEKKREYYSFIHDESERLSRLIANVLQLARLERNDFALKIAPATAQELMDLLRSKLHAQIERAGFEVRYTLDPACTGRSLSVDRDAFTQIVINLVDNALKFSAKAEKKAVDLGARCDEPGVVTWSVRDYGPGIPAAQLKKIFRLFYRPGSELTRQTTGTGIGLALARQLARAMGGEVRAINREPGAEFEVRLPAV